MLQQVGHVGRALLEIEKRNHTTTHSGSGSGSGSGTNSDSSGDGTTIDAEKGIFWVKLLVSLLVMAEIVLFGLLPAYGGRYINVSDRLTI